MSLVWSEVPDLLKRVTFKPNFSVRYITPQPGGDELGWVEVAMYVQDSTRTPRFDLRQDQDYDLFGDPLRQILQTRGMTVVQEVIRVVGQFAIPSVINTEERFFDWLKYTLLDLERHEFDEWFRIDGRLVHDPHAV